MLFRSSHSIINSMKIDNSVFLFDLDKKIKLKKKNDAEYCDFKIRRKTNIVKINHNSEAKRKSTIDSNIEFIDYPRISYNKISIKKNISKQLINIDAISNEYFMPNSRTSEILKKSKKLQSEILQITNSTKNSAIIKKLAEQNRKFKADFIQFKGSSQMILPDSKVYIIVRNPIQKSNYSWNECRKS